MFRYVLAIFLAVVLFSCSKKISTSKKDSTILSVNNIDIPSSDFEYAYEKNRKKDENLYKEKSVKEYLDLFINFKLKVSEAEELGIDSAPKFVRELENYKKQLAKPYLSDEVYIDELTKEAYSRSKEEVKASHLLLKLGPNSSPEDTLVVYNKISEIRDSLLVGSLTFEDAVTRYSQDPSAKTNKGDLGYFSAFRMVYRFENAAYNTEVGKVSKILRTQFGYHVLKVFDRGKSLGKFTVNHIMISKDNKDADNLINSIYSKLLEGDDWDRLCKDFSEHNQTKNNGGRLKSFGRGEIGSPEFEEAAFSLSNLGDVSKPVKTNYGYHVIQLVKIDTLEPYEEIEKDLRDKIKRSERSQLATKKLSDKLIRENGFSETDIIKSKEVYVEIDSLVNSNSWDYKTHSTLKDELLFTIAKEKYSLSKFYEHIASNKNSLKRKNIELTSLEVYNQFKVDEIIKYEMNQLPKKHPRYKRIVNEYREGIMLFDLMNDKIWKKAMKDSSGIEAFFNDNIANYQYSERAKVKVYTSANEQVIGQVKEMIGLKKSDEEIREVILKDDPLVLKIEDQLYSKSNADTPPTFAYDLKDQSLVHEGNHLFVQVSEILPAGPKDLSKIRGLVISDYQKELENKWIEELKVKYPVVVHQESVDKLIRK